MFNRLQSRRANLQRFASLNPASYEPFSAGQFVATVTQHFSNKIKVVGMKTGKRIAKLQVFFQDNEEEITVQIDFTAGEARVRCFTDGITFAPVDFKVKLVYIDYDMFDVFAQWIEDAIRSKMVYI